MSEKATSRRAFWDALLVLVCVVALLRLAGFVERFGRESLQRDFAAFYTAGEAFQYGLSPYRTHADHVPPIWDGIDVYTHSRFLYPPLVAALFRPLAAMPYAVAKRLWMLLTLGFVAGAMGRFVRAIGVPPDRRTVLALAALAALFHPLLTQLESGQIDALTLVLVSFALAPMVQGRRAGLVSGALLAGATLLKLNVVYLMVFALIRRKWRVLAGYALGIVGLGCLTLLVNGPVAVQEYVSRELPRIAQYGERGTTEMLLDDETLTRLRAGAPEGDTFKDGRMYSAASFAYVANASAARVVASRLSSPRTRTGEHRATTAVSLLLIGSAWLLAWLACRRRRRDPDARWEMAYWQLALAAVLLAGPLTWTMNLIWLLPLSALISASYPRLSGNGAAVALAGCVAGLLLAALPDHHSFTLLAPLADRFATWQYVVAEVVVLVSLFALLAIDRPDEKTGG